ncbi:MAG: hypothetical protein M1837_003967 [Sclerophora amabilis]|nr:MAG: hypothetical protein M1837_003967 [Sclerophora amabilis]
MGRKPNQLILEFFERGQKLEDASNRYQHTCRACGERFPKGRIDSLTTHLVKRCPVIALRDRQRALLQLHELPDLDISEGTREAVRKGDRGGDTKQLASRVRAGDPEGASQSWTPLETLAEVSRQIDLSEKRDSPPEGVSVQPHALDGSDRDGRQAGTTPAGEAALDQVVQHSELSDDFIARALSNANALPPIHFPGSPSHSPSSSPHLPGLSLPSNLSDIIASPSLNPQTLSTIGDVPAAPAKHGMPLEPELLGSSQNACLSDKFFNFRNPGPRSSATWPLVQPPPSANSAFPEGSADQAGSVETTTTRAATIPRLIAMNPDKPQSKFTSEFGTDSRAIRPKVRGRFTASRRKEVQEVRKRGACIRCRMLKKPCSGESPCSTCRNVESARLWKQPCIRTRIADELELYSAGLHAVLAQHDVNGARSQAQFHNLPGRIEATHYEDSTVFVAFSALEGRRHLVDGNLHLNGNDFLADFQELRLLDGETDDLPGKMELYMKKMAPTFFDRELSPFMKTTLSIVSDLASQKKDTLLNRVLELWSLNHILVDVEMQWKTYESPDPDIGGTRIPIDDDTNKESYHLLCAQLRSAAEKKAAQTSKVVMNELERRLLQRTQSGCFETFLVALCILNCVERSTWLFMSWDKDEYKSKVRQYAETLYDGKYSLSFIS